MVLLIVTLFTLYTGSVNAAEIKSFTPLTNIPLLESWQPGEEFEGSTEGVFNQLFSLSIRIGAMLAVFMFIWGGLHFITARDNPTSITKGREKMKNAVFGLLMLLSTFVVLNTINPQLLDLKFLANNTARLDPTDEAISHRNRIETLYIEKSGEKYNYFACAPAVSTGLDGPFGLKCYSSINQCVLESPEKCELYPPTKITTTFYYTIIDAPIFNSKETEDQKIYNLSREACIQDAEDASARGLEIKSIGTIFDICRGSQQTIEFMYGRNFTKP